MATVIDAEFVVKCPCPPCGAYVPQLAPEGVCPWCAVHCTVATARGRVPAPLDASTRAHQAAHQVDASPAPATITPAAADAIQLARKIAVRKWGAKRVARIERNARDAVDGLSIAAEFLRAIRR